MDIWRWAGCCKRSGCCGDASISGNYLSTKIAVGHTLIWMRFGSLLLMSHAHLGVGWGAARAHVAEGLGCEGTIAGM